MKKTLVLGLLSVFCISLVSILSLFVTRAQASNDGWTKWKEGDWGNCIPNEGNTCGQNGGKKYRTDKYRRKVYSCDQGWTLQNGKCRKTVTTDTKNREKKTEKVCPENKSAYTYSSDNNGQRCKWPEKINGSWRYANKIDKQVWKDCQNGYHVNPQDESKCIKTQDQQKNPNESWEYKDVVEVTNCTIPNHKVVACPTPTPEPTATPTPTPTTSPEPENPCDEEEGLLLTVFRFFVPQAKAIEKSPCPTPEPTDPPIGGPSDDDKDDKPKPWKTKLSTDNHQCTETEFDAVMDVKEDGVGKGGVKVTFYFNGQTVEVRSNGDGRARTKFARAAGTLVAEAEGYPTQSMVVEELGCGPAMLDPNRDGQVLGASTLADTGATNWLAMTGIYAGLAMLGGAAYAYRKAKIN